MKKTPDISEILQQVRVPASSELDERIHREIEDATTPAVRQPTDSEPTFGQIFALLLKKRSTRFTLATTLVLAILVALVLVHPAPSAWAMEQAIEAIKKYRGLQFTGNFTKDGKTYPLQAWCRAGASGNFVEAELIKGGDAGTLWTKDNKTYRYDSNTKTVYVESGITEALNPWPGPKLFALLSTAKDYKAIEGYDPATGRKRVFVTVGVTDSSYLLEFDFRTSLLVSLKFWDNPKQEGTPQVDSERVLYFDDLPDSDFNFQPPAGIPVVEMPLTISDEQASLPALSDPKYGISAEGMSHEEACRKILEQYWAANIKYDLAGIRQLVPLIADWPDAFLRETVKQNGLTQLLKIGGIEKTGESKVGPLALVPNWVRDENGAVFEVWVIVQFRKTDQGTSCVIYGHHGYANVKDSSVAVKPVLRQDEPAEAKVDPAVYDSLVGKYDLGKNGTLTVTRDGDHLFVQLTGQPMFEMFPKSETEYFLKVVNAQVTFVKDSAGKVTKTVVHMGDQTVDAPRI